MRWTEHIKDVKTHKHGNSQIQAIYDEYGCRDWKFEVLLELESDDTRYISLMENTMIDDHPNNVNRYGGVPKINLGIRYKDNPKLYRQLYHKEDYQYRKTYHKEYYQANKEKSKQYYQLNKERILRRYHENKEVDKVV